VGFAGVGILAWAQSAAGTQPLGVHRPAPDLILVPMPMPVGSGPDTGTFPVVVVDDIPQQPLEHEPQPL